MTRRKLSTIVGSLVLIFAVVGASGCLAIEEHVKVSGDGSIEEFRISMNMSKELYLLLLENTTSNSLCGDIEKNADEQVELTCDEKINGNQAIIVITAKDIKPENKSGSADSDDSILDGIRVYKEGDYLVYEDYTWLDEEESKESEDWGEFASLITLDYYLEMPGKIVDSNANIVNGNKAEWHMNGNQMGKVKIYAKSEVPKGICGPASVLGLALLPLLFRKRKVVAF